MLIGNLYCKNSQPPDNLLSWLTYRQMLTSKLYAITKSADLQVLRHDFSKATWWDKYVLKLQDTELLVREITISAFAEPCWFARTVVPISTYKKHERLFLKLENLSLGKLIFGNYGIERQTLNYYCINKLNLEYHWLPKQLSSGADELWMRLSEFSVDEDVFYLVEIFLPGLEKHIC